MQASASTDSPRDRRTLLAWTALGTLFCILLSLIYNYLVFGSFGAEVLQRSLLSAVILPLLLAGPLFLLAAYKWRNLTSANQRLDLAASFDSLTQCLNRGAFMDRVSAHLEQQLPGGLQANGALLVIDADHFKSINDAFGHDHGDEALTIIAERIRFSVRTTDMVGRLGGEEFAVFLPGIDLAATQELAERIRVAVNLAVFAPGGRLRQLSVSIGGAVFAGEVDFAGLYRQADIRLYEAKQFGRNRTEIADLRSPDFLRRRMPQATAAQ